jgi:hypothetical protein
MPIIKNIKEQFQQTKSTWGLYWRIYGGCRSILYSTYFLSALLFSLVCYPLWADKGRTSAWFDLCNSILPNIFGFTLGGYAILLAFGSSRFMELLAGDDPKEKGPSPFIQINASFLHFIVVQLIALVYSVFSLAWDIKQGFWAFLGFLLFSYALTTSIAAAFSILRLAKNFNDFVTHNKNDT